MQHLHAALPVGYIAGPLVQHGEFFTVAAAEQFDSLDPSRHNSGVAMENWIALPEILVETELNIFDAYEVHVYDTAYHKRLVAAIETVSPTNKDRPERRNAFSGKCAALLQAGVAVSIVDLVTDRQANLLQN